MSIIIDCVDLCRGCMTNDGDLIDMYDNAGISVVKDLPMKLSELTGIQLNEEDCLPNKLCESCICRVNDLFKFKNLVLKTDQKLRELFDFDSNEMNIVKYNDNSVKNEYCSPNDQKYPKEKQGQMNNVDSDAYEGFEDFIDHEEMFEATTVSQNSNEKLVPETKGDEKISKIKNKTARGKKASSTSPSKTSGQLQEKNAVQTATEIKKKPGILKSTNSIKTQNLEENEESDSVEDDDDEDSDFAKTDNNILGTVSDSVTRIKEIEVDGKPLEFQCSLCSHNYNELSDALLHMVDFHVSSDGPYLCIACEKDCGNMRDLKTHIKIHTGELPYKCFLCSKTYKAKLHFKRHIRKAHAVFFRNRCSKCGTRFKTKSLLEDHAKTHMGVYKCHQCSRQFNSKGNFKRHLVAHIDPKGLKVPRFPCSICSRRFTNRRTLATHTRVHTGEKPFTCDYCGKSFSQNGNLHSHLKTHTNPRSFTCEVCGKGFNQKSTLRDHNLLHSGEKPHTCSLCGLSFMFGAALRRHVRSHGGKPFKCEICESAFLTNYDLKRHLKIHNKPNPRVRVCRRKNATTTNVKVENENDNDSAEPLESQVKEENSKDEEMSTYLIFHDGEQKYTPTRIKIVAFKSTERSD